VAYQLEHAAAVSEKRRGEVSAFNLNGNMNISRRKTK
jgi:hypothetical protein